MYRGVRDKHAKMGDAFEAAILDNVEKAIELSAIKAEQRYEDEVQRIKDDGLTGKKREEAMEAAERAMATAKAKARWNKNARVSSLRAEFELNKIQAPYFPLMRFGPYFVTLRDKESGKVMSFSKFEKEKGSTQLHSRAERSR